MEFKSISDNEFEVSLNGQTIIRHSSQHPFLHVGHSKSSYHMHLGHFLISHELQTKSALSVENIQVVDASHEYDISFVDETKTRKFLLKFIFDSSGLKIEFPKSKYSDIIRSVIEEDQCLNTELVNEENDEPLNVWFSLEASSFDEETVRGCGLQFGEENHRQKILPIWVSEWFHDQLSHERRETNRPAPNTTYHPQPMFVSSRGYTFGAYGSAYASFDFSRENKHELFFVDSPYRVEFKLQSFSMESVKFNSLPDWIHDGVILSIQGGTETIENKLKTMYQAGTKIAGVWAQDWCGKRITSFGKRVFWNWQWNANWYPNLPEKINQWKNDFGGCRFLAYINPYIADDGLLFKEAFENDFLVKRSDSETTVYRIDFGEFQGGIVDLTNPQAFNWYKKVIRTHLIDIGISGWMADFGEYLPCDVHVHANIPGYLVHNLWPVLWARCNYEAIRDAGKLDEVVFFMRSGYLGVQRYCPLFWAGDQAVNFTQDAGLPAGIRSTMSLSLSNVLSPHTDIGGYFGRTFSRTREVLLRWCEMASFNIVMRSHEGNRPDANIQFDHDSTCIEFFARMSRIRAHLKPYTRYVVEQACQNKHSCIRPFRELEYLVGDDLLIAPVYQEEVTQWQVHFPDGEWIHIWTDILYSTTTGTVDAPLGQPPIFYRSNSEWKSLFEQVKSI